ncbi:MAG: acetylxylan esterase [Anaerolineae bacterium]|nr:acetylxylan esterase [Anaerolineae bacterium]MCO5204173.1 acetylxylan esterase [Anaerolineae bacterium]
MRSVDTLSVAEMQHYMGTNPRPADFDAYWDAALAELAGVDPDVALVSAEFQTPFARCEHLYFTGTGGARIHAKLLRPLNQTQPGPALLMFHGYSSNSGEWSDKLGYVAAGFTVAALDVRGQGGLSQDPGGTTGWTFSGQFVRGLDDSAEKLFFRHVYLDTVRLAQIVMALPGVATTRVGAMGGSQGGALTIACAALEPRIRLAAPTYPFLSDFKRVWELNLDIDAYAELRDYFRRFDPLHTREQALFEKLGYIDVHNLAPRVNANVLFALTLMDEICPPSTQFAVYNQLRSPKSLALYHDHGHEELPGHGDRVFQFMSQLM